MAERYPGACMAIASGLSELLGDSAVTVATKISQSTV